MRAILIFFQGCPLNRSDLRRVRTDRCRMCVILTRSDPPKEDPLLIDKESILCSLNIKTMTFPLALDPYADPQQGLQSPTPTSIPTSPSHRRSLILERGHEGITSSPWWLYYGVSCYDCRRIRT